MGAICFNRIEDILSGPALDLFFIFCIAALIISGVTFANTKFSSHSVVMYSVKFLLDGFIVAASSGPMFAKKLLNPSAISKSPDRMFSLFMNVWVYLSSFSLYLAHHLLLPMLVGHYMKILLNVILQLFL